jgi:hypothetical protein
MHKSTHANLEDFNVDGHATTLRLCILHRPDAHPLWDDYIVSLVHLRDIAGVPPASKRTVECTHEVMIWAHAPDVKADPTDVNSFRVLHPCNLVWQLVKLSDVQALKVFDRFLLMLAEGGANPDTDFLNHQIKLLKTLNARVRAES